MRSETGVSSQLGAKYLEPARGLEPIANLDVQEVDIER